MADSMGRALSAGRSGSPALMSAAFDWLARAQREPHLAHREWMERGAALMPLGTRFNAVCLSARIVHAGVDTDDPETVAAALAHLLCGPVLHHRPKQTYYALTAPHPPTLWARADEAPMLGAGHFLSVPAPDMLGPYGLHWVVRPRIVGDLCPVPSVAALVHIAIGTGTGGHR
ncbi:hypothetical protein ACFVYR_09920 [Streptomyces sp. NPDC058284]|uniref:hypothetical protein n=1 Tax=unclassified Streptomyces TaxID=2593676 RepID=UPI0036658011